MVWCKLYHTLSAVQTALQTCYNFSHDVKEVHFVLFGKQTYDTWIAQAEKYLKTAPDEGSGTCRKSRCCFDALRLLEDELVVLAF